MGILNFDESCPYAFVSYKSDDKELVVKDIMELQNRGVNIWFDEDLTVGESWDKEARPKLASKKCLLIIFYASPKALASVNVQKEIKLAKKFDKRILPINFFNKGFIEVWQEEIDNEEFKRSNEKGDINGALDLVTDCLDEKMTFLSREIKQGEDYYNDIIKTIERYASGIINKGGVASAIPASPVVSASSLPVTEQPAPAPAPAQAPPEPPGSEYDFVAFDSDKGSYDDVSAIRYKGRIAQVNGDFFARFVELIAAFHNEEFKTAMKSMPLKKIIDPDGVFIESLGEKVKQDIPERIKHIIMRLGINEAELEIALAAKTKAAAALGSRQAGNQPELGYRISFTLYQERFENKSLKEFMQTVYENVLNKHADKAAALESALSGLASSAEQFAYTTGDGVEKKYPHVPINVAGKEMYVNVNFSKRDSRREVTKLFNAAGENFDVLEIDGFEQEPWHTATRGGQKSFNLFGQSYDRQDQNDILKNTIEATLDRHPGSLEQIVEKCGKFLSFRELSYDEACQKGYSAFKSTGEIRVAGRTVYVGQTMNKKDKWRKVRRIINLTGENEADFSEVEQALLK